MRELEGQPRRRREVPQRDRCFDGEGQPSHPGLRSHRTTTAGAMVLRAEGGARVYCGFVGVLLPQFPPQVGSVYGQAEAGAPGVHCKHPPASHLYLVGVVVVVVDTQHLQSG